MRTTRIAVATVLAAAALAVGAQPRTEAGPGPFTYEALGAHGAFTYETLGGTPHVQVRKPVRTDVAAPAAAH